MAILWLFEINRYQIKLTYLLLEKPYQKIVNYHNKKQGCPFCRESDIKSSGSHFWQNYSDRFV